MQPFCTAHWGKLPEDMKKAVRDAQRQSKMAEVITVNQAKEWLREHES